MGPTVLWPVLPCPSGHSLAWGPPSFGRSSHARARQACAGVGSQTARLLDCRRAILIVPFPVLRTATLINTFLNLLFPMDCVVCRASALDWRSGPLCSDCEGQFEPLDPPFCVRCGLPMAADETQCGECVSERTHFDIGRSALVFDAGLRQVIHHFKYNNRVSLARPLGRALVACLDRECFTAGYVTPVPLHRDRERGRGYNQAALLAARLGRRLEPDIIRRRKNTETQTGLTRAQRLGNVRGAFECPRPINGSVLIVDDVQTTGQRSTRSRGCSREPGLAGLRC